MITLTSCNSGAGLPNSWQFFTTNYEFAILHSIEMNRKWSTYVQEPGDWGKYTCKQHILKEKIFTFVTPYYYIALAVYGNLDEALVSVQPRMRQRKSSYFFTVMLLIFWLKIKPPCYEFVKSELGIVLFRPFQTTLGEVVRPFYIIQKLIFSRVCLSVLTLLLWISKWTG